MTKPRAKDVLSKSISSSRVSRVRGAMSTSMHNKAVRAKSASKGRPGNLRVTIKSILPEFPVLDLIKVSVSIEMTWMEFLTSQNVTVDRAEHMIKTPKTISHLDDQISKTLEVYSRSCRFINGSIVPLEEILSESLNNHGPNDSDQMGPLSLEEISEDEADESDMEPPPEFETNTTTPAPDNVNVDGNNVPNPSGVLNQHDMDFSGSEDIDDVEPRDQWKVETEVHPFNTRRILNPTRIFGNSRSRITDSLNMTCINSPPAPVNLMSTPARIRNDDRVDFMRDIFRFGRPNRVAPVLENSVSSQEDEIQDVLVDTETENLKDQVLNEFRKIPIEDLIKIREELVTMQNESRRYQWSRHAPMTSCAIMMAFQL